MTDLISKEAAAKLCDADAKKYSRTGNNRGCGAATRLAQAIRAMTVQDGWLPIEEAPTKEDYLAYMTWNGAKVYPGMIFEGSWVDAFSNYINPQPTHYQPRPSPPEADDDQRN